MTVAHNRGVMITRSVGHLMLGHRFFGSSRLLSLSRADCQKTGCDNNQHQFPRFHDVSSRPRCEAKLIAQGQRPTNENVA